VQNRLRTCPRKTSCCRPNWLPKAVHLSRNPALLAGPGEDVLGAGPAPRLPKVIGAWEEPQHNPFAPRTAWSLFNAFTDVGVAQGQGGSLKGRYGSRRCFGGSCSSRRSFTRPPRDGWPRFTHGEPLQPRTTLHNLRP
jgi:hypothetical protein